nr:MAG TPA: hypothetical protein [Herelleviridae sp.]
MALLSSIIPNPSVQYNFNQVIKRSLFTLRFPLNLFL